MLTASTCFAILFAFLKTDTLRVGKRIVVKHFADESKHHALDSKSIVNLNVSEDHARQLSPVYAEELAGIVSKINKDIVLGNMLGKGGYGIAFDARVGGKKRVVVKFTAVNTRVKNQTKIPVATWESPCEDSCEESEEQKFRKRLVNMAKECSMMWRIQHTKKGKIAVQQDPAGASALSECLLNCHRQDKDCRTEDNQPPFMVVEYAGMNGKKWLDSMFENRSLMVGWDGYSEIVGVLNQVREGLRFMTEVRNPPILHHDLKWDNVCIRPIEELDDSEKKSKFIFGYKAQLIDFGAAIKLQYYKDRKWIPTVGTRGFAAPEAFLGVPYEDPAWSFDMYALGAMALNALCEVSQLQLFHHAEEMNRLLWCSAEEICIKKEQCNATEDCHGNASAAIRCCPEEDELPKIPITRTINEKEVRVGSLTCDLNKETFCLAQTDIDFTQARLDYSRVKEYDRLHDAMCKRVATDEQMQFETPESYTEWLQKCKGMTSLIHPNPRKRQPPSTFKFDEHRGTVKDLDWAYQQSLAVQSS